MLLKSDLDVQQTNLMRLEAGSLKKRLILSSSSRCDQIYEYEFYDFSDTFCAT